MSSHVKYDVIIAGSGIGGLSAALILAKAGKKVCVLEKNQQLGGNLQVFSRDKRIFDTGVHYIGGLDEGENLYQFFKYFDILDDIEIERLDEQCFDRIILKDKRVFDYAQGYDQFSAQLKAYFPDEIEAIDKYCDLMQEMCSCFPLYNLELDSENSYLKHAEILEKNAFEVISSLTKNQDLINVLSGSNALYAGVREKTPFYVHALVVNSYLKGAYRVIKGGGQIAKAFAKQIRLHGGDIFKRAEVVGANYHENGLIKSVITSDGNEYFGDYFISNFHPSQTIKLFGEDRFLKAYSKRIQGLENTISPFIVHLSLKDSQIPYKNFNEYYIRIDDVWNNTHCDRKTWPEEIFISSPSIEKKQAFTDSLSIMAYMPFEWVEEWKASLKTIVHNEERASAYYQYKKELEQHVLSVVEEIYPGISEHVINTYSSSPLTFRDYLNNPDGNFYGILKDCNNPAKTMINPRTKVKNLLLTGQNIVFHGVLGGVVGAFVTVFEILDKNVILNEVKKAQN